MEESILTSVKHALGIDDPSYTPFDPDIIMHINSIINVLNQLGISPDDENFTVTDETTKWSDYRSDMTNLQMIKSYIYMRVRLLFDPPSSASVINVLNETIKELEFRLNVQVDPGLF